VRKREMLPRIAYPKCEVANALAQPRSGLFNVLRVLLLLVSCLPV
jgi:hypothetical protein